tara:strand:- start:39657 stop:40691 length:1035 start_codon:yes stop_codon:yes gene_type:complete
MRLRDQVALTLPSLLLRLVLGITFVYAGTGKIMGTASVTGDDAARLANIGIMPTLPVEVPAEQPEDPDAAPVIEAPTEPDLQVDPQTEEQAEDIVDEIKALIENSTPETTPSPEETPADVPEELPAPSALNTNNTQYVLSTVQHTGTVYAGSDFPDAMEVKQVYGISLMISRASDPGLTADSTPITPIMPAMFASKPWPKIMAWSVAITEIAAGAFLLLGFLTRLSAMSLAIVMLVAMWMTQFGPAMMRSTDAILGFIPRADNLWASPQYQTMLWQLALVAMCAALFFLGAGAVSVDRLLFKPGHRDPYVHGDPKAGKPKKTPKNSTETNTNRSEFDRSPNLTP